ADDPSDGYVLAVSANFTGPGLNSTIGPIVRTWSFAHGNWSELRPAVSPPNRWGAALFYDPSSTTVVLFGGLGTQGFLNDTWTFHGGRWTNATPSTLGAPSARAFAAVAWDALDSYGVLFGGYDRLNLTDTWAYTSGNWTLVAASGVGPHVAGGAMAADPADGSVVYFGGQYSSTARPSGDTWKFSGGTWVNRTSSLSGNPGARWNPALAADPSTDRVVLFGGATRATAWVDQNDTWQLSSAGWVPVTSSAPIPGRQAAQLSYDSADAGLVLFGGYNETSVLDDTWLFNVSTGWTQADPILHLSRSTVDVGLTVTVVAGAEYQPGPVTFTLSGILGGCSPTSGTHWTCAPTSPGTYPISVKVSSDGQVAVATQWLVVRPAPSIAGFTAARTTLDLGQSVTFGVVAAGGVGPFRFAFTGLPSGCLTSNTSNLTCRPTAAGSSTVRVLVTDALGLSATGTLDIVVHPALSVPSVEVSAARTTVGYPVSLVVDQTGGTLPYSYAFLGLPPGCVGGNRSTLTCSPSLPGNYSVQVTVTDAAGASVNGSTAFEVVALAPGGGPSGFWAEIGTPGSLAAGFALGAVVAVAAAIGLIHRYRLRREGAVLRSRLEETTRTGSTRDGRDPGGPPRGK
ncbi:MAG TPA: kelch repeat-containing protein, partial [Thermoplasmata archaeon]|nr:kelch repeat-containing protein [Thermoplasmata archaeon]